MNPCNLVYGLRRSFTLKAKQLIEKRVRRPVSPGSAALVLGRKATMGRSHKRKNNRRGPVRSVRRPCLTGTVQLTEARGFVHTAEGDFKLTGRGAREVMDGDTVAISFKHGTRGERTAVVESVLARAATSIVGTYDAAGPLGVVKPLDTRLRADFFILPTDDSPARYNVEPRDIVSARIVTYPTRMESGVVTVERKIGSADAPDLGIQCVMARYGLTDGYPQAALDEAEGLELDIEQALQDPLRRDIRDRFLITIDPVDARDFDDAISIERTPEGGFKLGVHIADVSHYVPWESHIDLEARHRTTSVYLADRVLPMLPERLCNNLCSLRPQEDRLAFTVDIALDKGGRVRSYKAYPSVIRSRVRMDYAGADALLQQAGTVPVPERGIDEAALARGKACAAQAKAEGRDLTAFLAAAYGLSQLRVAARRARGAVDFDTVEVHALLDAEGLPTQLVARHRTAATGLIEEAMLLANECVAERLDDQGVPAAYRVHEPPSPDSLHGAATTLAELGIIDPETAAAIALGDQAAMQRAVDDAKGTAAAPLVNTLLLRAMQRALYKPRNEGHYALGAPAYCHFTSPIRRYPDLLVHRALKMQLAQEHLGRPCAAQRAPQLTGTGRECMERILPQLCRACSDHERAADAAAKATQKIKVAQYYADRVGERYAGTIIWISSMGVFVRLDDTQVEGLVPMRTLGDEWFDLNEDELSLTGTSTGTRYELGQRAIIEVESANTVRGHLNFSLVHAG